MFHREWFASTADNVLVGHMRCKPLAPSSIQRNFPSDESLLRRVSGDGKGCLHMAFKVDREMHNQRGDLLSEKFIRTTHWSNRRRYEIVTESQDAKSTVKPNAMAFSLSHAPTCKLYMHRYVETCGVVLCGGKLGWGGDKQGRKAILCNSAEDAVVLSTSVVGNYPEEGLVDATNKPCKKGDPYNDQVSVRTM